MKHTTKMDKKIESPKNWQDRYWNFSLDLKENKVTLGDWKRFVKNEIEIAKKEERERILKELERVLLAINQNYV